MFFHVFKYYLRVLVQEKGGLFWTLVFPMVLATFFNLAFTNIDKEDFLKDIPVAIVSSDKADTYFLDAMEGSGFFTMQETDQSTAEKLLAHGDIKGFITWKDEPTLTVGQSGMEESLLKTFMDAYEQRTSTTEQVLRNNPQGLTQAFLDRVSLTEGYTQAQPVGSSNNTSSVYFFALLAMTVLMMATYGNEVATEIQANQSPLAARNCVAPVHKMKIFLASISATFVLQFACILIVLTYMIGILGVNFGESLGKVVLLCMVGCIMSVSFGAALSALIPKSDNIKIGIIVGVTMLESFLAGLMAVEVKYLIQKTVPVLGYLNPAALITDGLYTLYYYDTFERYYLNLGILAAMAVVFCIIAYSTLRRQKYASI